LSRRVLLLRHGRTAWNAERRFQGQADPPLDPVGRVQASEVAALVAAFRPGAIVASDLLRASQTAEPLGALAGVPLQLDARFRERSLGHWEGLTRDDVAVRYPDEYADWVAGRDVRGRGAETRDDVAKRALAAFYDLPEVEVAVVVTHSATAMSLCSALIGLVQGRPALGPLANCHWSEMWTDGLDGRDRDEPVWRLRAHNVGVPGPIIPVAVSFDRAPADEAPDAEA
jgi:glucosyl-3-phosphoglycerate phosphatase